MARFRIKGVNDDRDTCDCCGKTGLKKVVWIEDLETQEIRAFGTSCATSPTKAFGLTSEIKKATRVYAKEQANIKKRKYFQAIVAACKASSSESEKAAAIDSVKLEFGYALN